MSLEEMILKLSTLFQKLHNYLKKNQAYCFQRPLWQIKFQS